MFFSSFFFGVSRGTYVLALIGDIGRMIANPLYRRLKKILDMMPSRLKNVTSRKFYVIFHFEWWKKIIH